jgi:hypothetical protein
MRTFRRRGYITQLVEALTRPPDATSEAEIEIELENQLGMEIDQALGLAIDAAEADVVVDLRRQ